MWLWQAHADITVYYEITTLLHRHAVHHLTMLPKILPISCYVQTNGLKGDFSMIQEYTQDSSETYHILKQILLLLNERISTSRPILEWENPLSGWLHTWTGNYTGFEKSITPDPSDKQSRPQKQIFHPAPLPHSLPPPDKPVGRKLGGPLMLHQFTMSLPVWNQ